jgi:hypothetical protein
VVLTMPAALLFVIYLLAVVAFIVAAVLSRRAPAACLVAVGLALFALPAMINAGQAAF